MEEREKKGRKGKGMRREGSEREGEWLGRENHSDQCRALNCNMNLEGFQLMRDPTGPNFSLIKAGSEESVIIRVEKVKKEFIFNGNFLVR